MEKQEIEHKLEQAFVDKDAIGDHIIKLQKELREAEKPELRHGDFGYSGKHPRIVLNNKKLATGFYIIDDNESDRPTVIYGNIIDLIKEWGEDLEEFDVGGRHFKIYPNDPDSFLQIEEIWHKLGQLIFTLKRKQGRD